MKAWQVRRFVRSIGDPRPYSHVPRMIHFFNYTHVAQRRRLTLGRGTFISPTVSFNNAERISIGDGSHLGAGCLIWAGPTRSRIELGHHTLLGPGVVMMASNYDFDAGTPTMDQERKESDIVLGPDVWIGANAVVLAGITIGTGCVVGAGSVVTHDLPPGAVAVGNPARVLRWRKGFEPAGDT